MFDRAVIEDIRSDALQAMPRESCGIVTEGRYVRCHNAHEDPEQAFRIAAAQYWWISHGSGIQAIVHSHPHGPDHPTIEDMRGQIASGVPWGIVCVTAGSALEPFFWGDGVPIPDLVGRPFRHGVTDCYSLVRDWYRMERGVVLPEYPRDHYWWDRGYDLYRQHFAEAGFVEIAAPELPGDIVIGRVLGPVENHAAVYLGDGLILHHLAGRLSRREPLGPWRRFATLYLRHEDCV